MRELAAKTDLSPCRGDDANNSAASAVAPVAWVAFITEEEAPTLEAKLAALEARCATEDIRIARAEARVEAAAQAGLT